MILQVPTQVVHSLRKMGLFGGFNINFIDDNGTNFVFTTQWQDLSERWINRRY